MNKALFRHGTSDAAIWENVVDRNEYRFGQFNSNDLCLDIGANTGAATYAMLQHGAGKVIAFEPDPDNFAIFRKQLKSEIYNGLVECYPLAVVGGSGFSWRTFSGVVRSDGQINHGGAFLLGENGEDYGLKEFIVNRPFKVPCITMEEVWELVPPDREFKRRLLKLDCEGSEWGIIRGMFMDYWEEIVGEYHPSGDEKPEVLSNVLSIDGFSTEIVPHPNSSLGLFFATRK